MPSTATGRYFTTGRLAFSLKGKIMPRLKSHYFQFKLLSSPVLKQKPLKVAYKPKPKESYATYLHLRCARIGTNHLAIRNNINI